MPTFYSFDGSRATFQEYAWSSKNPIVLTIAAVIKLFRIKTSGSSDDANVDSTREFVVAELPADLQEKFASLAAEIQSLGFCDPVYHIIDDHLTRTKIVWATYRHASGFHCARIHYRYWGKVQKTERALFPMFITAFPNGTFAVSSSGRPDVAAPDSIRMNRMFNATTPSLWVAHEKIALEMSGAQGCLLVTTQQEVIEITERLHETQRDFHLARGFFRKRTEEETKDGADHAVRIQQARDTGQQYPEVMAELGKLQDAKANWKSGMWLLLISVLGFIAAGGKQWNWKLSLMLVPILFFHEAGHWLAMRIFGYRNLRMFFIPFFGAAVTGRHWNVAGWKKALVSLAGPLPGIILGAGLTAVALLSGNANIRSVAFLLVILNGFNLAPLLPFDGGRFLQATLFCRNRHLDFIFKLLAIGGLFALSATRVSPTMLYVGIALAIGLPLSYKLGKVTDDMRATPMPPMLPGQDHISPATAAPLIEAVKTAVPKSTNNKIIAQHVLNVYETINARPPGALATIGLMMLYGGGLIVSALCILLLAVANNGSVGDFFRRAVLQPRHSVACNGYHVVKAAETPAHLDGARDLVVATFRKNGDADKLFADTSAKLPAKAALMQFGDSVLLSLPTHDASRAQWFDKFQTATTNTFTVLSNNTVSVSLMFLASSAEVASNLQAELNDYGSVEVAPRLAPPWDDSASSAELAHRKNVRRIWHEFQQTLDFAWTNESVKSFSKQISSATRRGDMDQVAELEKQRDEAAKKIQTAARERLKAKYSTGDFADLVALNAEAQDVSITNRAARKAYYKKLASSLGAASETSAPGLGFYCDRSGMLLQISYAGVRDPQYSLPAMMRWLCAQGCTGFKYDIISVSYDSD